MKLFKYLLSLSIHVKLAVLIIFMVLAIFSSTVLISINFSKQQTAQVTDKLIQSNINTNSEFISRVILEKDYWNLYKFLKALTSNEVVKEIGIIDNNNAVLAYSNPKKFKSGTVITDLSEYESSDIVNNDTTLGKIILIVDDSNVETLIEKTLLQSLYYITIVGLLVFLIAYLFLKRIINRFQVVIHNMNAISHKNWDEIQSDLSGEKDELNDLISQSIDTMHAIKDSMQRETTMRLFYHNVLNSMDSLIIICDKQMQIQYHNNHQLCAYILNESKTLFEESIYEYVQKQRASSFSLKVNDSHYLFFNILLIEERILLNVSDITKLKEAEENDKALHSLELVRDVSSQFAHEIKNLLQPLALLIPKNKQPDQEDLPIIHRTLTKMKSQVSDYLLLGRTLDLTSQEPQYPHLVLEELLAILKNRIEEKSLKVIVDVDETVCLSIHKQYIELILMNLITNAIEASNANSIMTIEWKNLTNRDTLLTIQNSGEPIKDVDKIFKPFFTTKKEGSGLGLFTVYKIVYTAKGKIDVTSDTTHTTFNIYLPKGKQQ